MTNYKKIFSYVGLLLILLISAECPDNGVENVASNGGASSEDTDDSEDIDDVDLSKNYGYGHFTFRYFYYPKDNTIYYSSKNDIYKVNLDGQNPQKIQDNKQQNTTDRKYKLQHVYVFDDVVYYNDAVSNDTRKVAIDGTNDVLQTSGSSGAMRMYESGGTLYFHDDTKYIKDNTLYYLQDERSSDVKLFKKSPPDASAETRIIAGQAMNFVFGPDGIYFVSHNILTLPSDFKNYYKVARISYDVTPNFQNSRMSAVDKNNMDILMPESLPRVDDFRDVSEHVIAYFMSDSVSGDRPVRDVWSFHRTTKKAQKLVRGYSPVSLRNSSREEALISGRSTEIGAIRIISSWVYYMIDDAPKNTNSIAYH